MIEEIVPPTVIAVEAYDDSPDGELFPAEEAALGRAVEKRRREFTTARVCARAALARLGVPPAPIVPDGSGAPVWPAGIVGSITHCAGYRACAVARTGDIAAIGLDAEPNEPLPDGVFDAIAGSDEVAHLRDGTPDVCWDRLLFSAKESVYKAWFPLTGQRLDFGDAAVTIDRTRGRFTARLLVPAPQSANGVSLSDLDGRWLARDGLVVTTFVLPLTRRSVA